MGYRDMIFCVADFRPPVEIGRFLISRLEGLQIVQLVISWHAKCLRVGR